jgi:hypothetical protein
VTGTFADGSGNPLGGSVTFTPSEELIGPAGEIIIAQTPIVSPVSSTTGVMTPVTLACTDNATLSPQPWTWTIAVAVPGAVQTVTVYLPHTLGSTVDLSALEPVGGIPSPSGTYVISVNGQSGSVAVTPAGIGALAVSGGTMTGPLALAADPVSALQAATKEYVDAHGGGGGAVSSVFGRGGAVVAASGDYAVAQVTGAAPLASPALTGTPTVPTQTAGDNSTKIATTAYVATAQAAAIAASGPLLAQAAVQASAYAAAANQVVPCDISGGSFTVSLPSAPAAGTLFAANVIAVSGVGVNTLTLATQGSDVFDKPGGAVTATLTLLHQSLLYEYTSGVWAKVAGADPYLQVASARQGVYYLDQYAGTDDQKMALALAAVTAGQAGGTIVLSPRAHTFASDWYIPNSSPLTSAYAVRIKGAGSSFNGQEASPAGITAVTFNYTGGTGNGVACIDVENTGTCEITGIDFVLPATYAIPLLQDTNATLFFHDCTVTGGYSGTACTQSGIVLGGGSTSGGIGSGPGAKYNGYGTVIQRNQFHGIQHCVTMKHGCNGVRVRDNLIDAACGSSVPLDAPIILNGGGASNPLAGNTIADNIIEVTYYTAGVNVTQASECKLGPNGFYDPPASGFLACYVIDSTSTYNEITDGYRTGSTPFLLDYSGTSKTAALQPQSAQNYWPPNTASLFQGSLTVNNGSGLAAMDAYGDKAYFQPSYNLQGYPTITLGALSCSQFTDGIVYAGSHNLVSPSAAVFVATDIGETVRLIAAFANFTMIAGVWTHSFAPAWQASYAYSLGDIAIPVTATTHLYQCTTAGTSASSQPAWPTGGGTVTDGTAAWTDLGTTATCAVLTAASSVTASAQTFYTSRASGSTLVLVEFNRYHIVSQGSAPAWAVNANAGSGATVAVTAGSTDLSQEITLTTGTGPASGIQATGSASLSFNYRTPKVVMTPKNAASATAVAAGLYVTNTGLGWTINAQAALSASTAYIFDIFSME